MVKMIILCENTAGIKLAKVGLSEWGLSVFIKVNRTNILLDTGHTQVYQHNAEQLDIDLNDTHFVVLSHHHWDHSGGLRFHKFKEKKKIIIHPQILEKLPSEEYQKIKNDFETITSEKPLEFSEDIYYLGEIPRENSFERGMYKEDKMLDDSAIAIKSARGVIVVTGCSHSGVCNICEYAKKVTGQNLYAVIGGFHLFENDLETVEATIEYFKAEKPAILCPMHCVDFPTLSKLHTRLGIEKLSTGDTKEFKC